jgi:hypothetical protein
VSGSPSAQTFQVAVESEAGKNLPLPEGQYLVSKDPEKTVTPARHGRYFFRIEFDPATRVHPSNPRKNLGIFQDADFGSITNSADISAGIAEILAAVPKPNQTTATAEDSSQVPAILSDAPSAGGSESVISDSASLQLNATEAPGTDGSLGILLPDHLEKLAAFMKNRQADKLTMIVDYGLGSVEKPDLYNRWKSGVLGDSSSTSSAPADSQAIYSPEQDNASTIAVNHSGDGRVSNCNADALKKSINWGKGLGAIDEHCSENGTHTCQFQGIYDCAVKRSGKVPGQGPDCDISTFCQPR